MAADDDLSELPDPLDALTPQERLGFEMLQAIEGRLVTDDTFRATERATNHLIGQMQEELDAQRVLTKYNRRTWFQVMAYLVFGIAALTSLGQRYDGVWLALVFPLVSHDGGPEVLEAGLRVLGGAWQLGLMYYLWKISQVPQYLLSRVTSGAMTEAQFLEKYPHNDRRLKSLPHHGPERRQH